MCSWDRLQQPYCDPEKAIAAKKRRINPTRELSVVAAANREIIFFPNSHLKHLFLCGLKSEPNVSLKCDLISLCCNILQRFRHVPSNLFCSVTDWIHSHCVSELKDGLLSAIQYPIKIHFLPLIWEQGSRIYCASCVHWLVLMIYPDMMHNQFKRKLDFLPLSRNDPCSLNASEFNQVAPTKTVWWTVAPYSSLSDWRKAAVKKPLTPSAFLDMQLIWG